MSLLKIVQEPRKNRITHLIAVGAGKGGVGKSTLSVNLALALKARGFRVGLLDADVYGPSLEQMLPEGLEPVSDEANPDRIIPALTHGIPFISVAHFKKDASIVRAPIANSLIDQFLNTVDWPELDILLVDFPPGTGDIQLTLMQKAPLSGAVVVTTPQVVATLDVRKAIQLFHRMEIPVMGIVENMSYLPGPEPTYPFGKGGAELLAKEFSLPVLGKVPIDPMISEAGDSGKALSQGVGFEAFSSLGERVDKAMAALPKQLPQIRQLDSAHLEIEVGGRWRSLPLSLIQKNCPCARCSGSDAKKLDPSVSLLEFSPVGRYAVRIVFSLGCRQGIYPISLLEQLVKQ